MSSTTTMFSRMRGKAKMGILIEGCAILLGTVFAFMLVSYFLDRNLRLEEVYRVGLLAVLVLGLWFMATRHLFAPLRVGLSDDELALAVERKDDLNQALISAVQFEHTIARGDSGAESMELMQHVVRDVHARAAAFQDDAALDAGRVRRFAAVIFGCVAVVCSWAISDHDSLILWAKRNLLMSAEEWPRLSRLSFAMDAEDGVVRIAEGNDLTVEVQASGVIPEQVFINYDFADGTTGEEPMALTGGERESGTTRRFTWLLQEVISDVTLYATGGDGLTEEIRVQLVKRPVLRDLVITKTYPGYMKLDPELVPASEGDIRIPAGVSLSLQGKSTKELENAFLTYGHDEKRMLAVDADKQKFGGVFEPAQSGVLTVDVTDRDGLGAHKPVKIFMRIVQDRAPLIEYKTRGLGSMILYKAKIPGVLRCRDDFGLTEIVARIRTSGGDGRVPGEEEEENWETGKFEGLRQPSTEEMETDIEQELLFDLLTRNDLEKGPTDTGNPIRPGMFLAIQFEARDNFGPGEHKVGKSEVLTLRVVTEEKLMQDLHRRQGERRRELTRILDKEKDYKSEIEEILSPTSGGPKAALAKLRLQAIARDQRALEKQVLGVAQRYRQILDEYTNNRVLRPNQISQQRANIEKPLEKLAKEDFPDSAQEVHDFAHLGLEDLRTVASASYGAIIKVLEQVIRNMRHLESVAGILEDVRRIRDLERGVEKGSKQALDKEDRDSKEIEGPGKKR